MVPFSILDLAFVTQGATPADALRHSLDLAQHAERWGYRRFWLAEHHNMVGIASAATSVVIGYVAGGTKTIRVGAGGIMLPNHSPIVIAEQFGTLESLYPGRIDLGLGRAPGTDQRPLRALRRDPAGADSFPTTCVSFRRFSDRCVLAKPCRLFPVRASTSPSGSSDQVFSARNWPRNSGCHMLSLRTLPPTRSCRRFKLTARSSNLPRSLTVRMPWWA
jgi:luciferase family oxidoreductase group 1